MTIDAVVFDLDGVLIDSEPIWSEVRHGYALAHGGRWADDADRQMMGMATMEWATYLHDELRVEGTAVDIARDVVEEMAARYDDGPPVRPGAVETVDRLARRWPLGLASSSPTRLIDVVLRAVGLTDRFRVTMSTEEVGVGKPAPDIYLEVARRLGVDPGRAAAVEDSTNGLRSALAAGLRVIAVPTPSFPPAPDVLARAAAVVGSLTEITDAVVDPPTRAITPPSS